MKIFKLVLSGLSLITQLPSSASATEVVRFNGSELNQAKLHFKATIDDVSRVIKISAADLNICDDTIAKAISYPRPLSVTEALEAIQTESAQLAATGKMMEIDLSTNTICDEGAGLIGAYFSDKSIQVLDLSWNRITDEGILTLVKALKVILSQPSFKLLNIKGNYGANSANIKKLLSLFDLTEQEAVKSKIQI